MGVNKDNGNTLGTTIRNRRRQLDFSQAEVAERIGTSIAYVGHIEAGRRRPSSKALSCIAEMLGLDQRKLFFLANPHAEAIVTGTGGDEESSAWAKFRDAEKVRRALSISGEEMELLSHVALMGEVRSDRDFIYILNTIRQALGR